MENLQLLTTSSRSDLAGALRQTGFALGLAPSAAELDPFARAVLVDDDGLDDSALAAIRTRLKNFGARYLVATRSRSRDIRVPGFEAGASDLFLQPSPFPGEVIVRLQAVLKAEGASRLAGRRHRALSPAPRAQVPPGGPPHGRGGDGGRRRFLRTAARRVRHPPAGRRAAKPGGALGRGAPDERRGQYRFGAARRSHWDSLGNRS